MALKNLRFAVIPWSEKFLQDRMFMMENMDVNRDHLMEPFLEMKQEFEKRGDIFHTIDLYDINDVDYFLFFVWNLKMIREVVRLGKADRMIYCNSEPPVVEPTNTPKGFRFLKRFFPYIMTWNDDWVDNHTIFKRNIPYYFCPELSSVPFAERKLLTCISGNKVSEHPDELYSERVRAINFFENNYPDDFDFYGTGWKADEHICYRGKADSKAAVYHNYRFAICYENMRNIKGYVTEKILDCICSGIVPVYAGASNICEYVPQECFIAFDDFEDYAELADFLINMDEQIYKKYLDSAQSFLNSELVNNFGGADYAGYIYFAIEKQKHFKCSRINRLYLDYLYYKSN